jgi:hypothetical protein
MMGDFARNIRATTHERGKMNDTTVRPHPRPLSRTDAFNNEFTYKTQPTDVLEKRVPKKDELKKNRETDPLRQGDSR